MLTSSNEENLQKIELALYEMNRLEPEDRFFQLLSANNSFSNLKYCMDTLRDSNNNLDKDTINKLQSLMVKAKSIADLKMKKKLK